MGSASPAIKPFAEQGSFTIIHDTVLDRIMPRCPGNAFKVLMFILRKTKGYGKDEDPLSYSQIQAGTGIKSRDTIAQALEWLAERDMLVITPTGHNTPTRYRLNKNFKLSAASVPKSGTATVPKTGSTKESKKERLSKSNDLLGESLAAEGPRGLSPRVISLAQHTMTAIYEAMKQAGFAMPGKEYGRQVARVEWMLGNMHPTDAELEALPDGFVRAYKIYGIKTDAPYALNEMRRQPAREEVLAESEASQVSGTREAPHPHSTKAQQAREKPRGVEWYLAFYPDVDEAAVERWLGQGLPHSAIVSQLSEAQNGGA